MKKHSSKLFSNLFCKMWEGTRGTESSSNRSASQRILKFVWSWISWKITQRLQIHKLIIFEEIKKPSLGGLQKIKWQFYRKAFSFSGQTVYLGTKPIESVIRTSSKVLRKVEPPKMFLKSCGNLYFHTVYYSKCLNPSPASIALLREKVAGCFIFILWWDGTVNHWMSW